MPISYKKAFDLMKEKKLTSTQIRKEKILSEWTLQSMRENKSVTLESLEKLCLVLNCQFGDLVEFIPPEWPKGWSSVNIETGELSPVNEKTASELTSAVDKVKKNAGK